MSSSSSSSRATRSDGLINFYELIPKEMKSKRVSYKNYDEVKIDLPMRVMILGSSSAGKTNIALNLIKKINIFTKFFIFAKNLNEDLYRFFIYKIQQKEVELSLKYDEEVKLVYTSSNVEEIPGAEEFDKNENNIVIIDDMICEKNLKSVSEIFTRGRKVNVSVIWITQSYFQTPKLIRQNTDYIIMKKINLIKDFKLIQREYSINEDLHEKYKEAVKGDFRNFFLIDLNASDERYRFRRNFLPFE